MIDPKADRAAFRQLADLLRDRILSGDLPPGAPLPSELRLVQEYGLSRTTVRQAMAILRSEGLVLVQPPRGTFVRLSEATETVKLRPGDTVTARMPTPEERRSLDVPEGVPVLVITHADGTTDVHPSNRARVVK
ncbi:MAG TPA: GntR family transcriptional regulator [Micromonospora sp.]|nr:GntR family transcriptional regulator [Micromonospora sp.]